MDREVTIDITKLPPELITLGIISTWLQDDPLYKNKITSEAETYKNPVTSALIHDTAQRGTMITTTVTGLIDYGKMRALESCMKLGVFENLATTAYIKVCLPILNHRLSFC